MEAIKNFFVDYWHFCQWYLVGIGVAYLILLGAFRQPGKAMGVLVLGLYLTMTAFFWSRREGWGVTEEAAIGIVIVTGLGIAALMYYAYFIRAD